MTLFNQSRLINVTTICGTPSGDAEIVSFELAGQSFMAISAGPYFKFNPSISLMVACDSVEEVDVLWKSLSEGGRTSQKITPNLLFSGDACGRTEEAVNYYTKLFPDSMPRRIGTHRRRKTTRG